MPLVDLYVLLVDHDSFSIASLGGREANEFEGAAREQNFEVVLDVVPTWMWLSSGLIARRWKSIGTITPEMQAA